MLKKHSFYSFLLLFLLLLLESKAIGISQNYLFDDDTVTRKIEKEKIILPAQIIMAGTSPIAKTDSLIIVSERIKYVRDLLDKLDYSTAYAVLQKAYSSCPAKVSDKKVLLDIIQARIKLNFYNDNETISLLNKTDSIVRKLNNDSLLALHLNNLGVYYYKWTKDKNRTNMCFRYALSLNKKIDSKREIARILNNMAISSDNSDESIKYLREAIEINLRLGNRALLAINYSNLGLKYVNANKNRKALEFLLLAEDIIKEDNLSQIIPILYKNKAEMYSKMGKNKEAYEYFKKAVETGRSSTQKNYIRNLEYMATQNSLSEKSLQLKVVENEYQIKTLNRNIVFTGIIIFILAILLFIIAIYYQNTRKIYKLQMKNKMKEQSLEHNKKELINMATFIKTRYNILENIHAEIDELQNQEKNITQQKIKKLKLYVKSLMNERDIHQIQQRIDEINKEFLERLEKLHPKITKNDKKIASLLRANLSTKQIAVVLNTYPSSVNIARHRMRQHMNLDNAVNLVNYIKKI